MTSSADGPLDNRERILEAGFHEFAKVGFSGARVDAIAARSGVNKQLIYHYFGGKSELYAAVIERKIRESMSSDAWADAAVQPAPDFGRTEFQRLLGWEGLEYTGGEIPLEPLRREAFGLLERDIRRAQEEGRVDARIDPSILTLVVAMALLAPPVLAQITQVITGRDPREDDLAEDVGRAVRQLLGLED